MKKQIIEEIANKLINALGEAKDNNGKWSKPWVNKAGIMPTSLATGKQYNGINSFILSLDEFNSNLYGTFNHFKKLGLKVKKGSTGQKIVHYDIVKKEDKETKEVNTFPVLRTFTVFAAEQVEGFNIDEYTEQLKQSWEENRTAEKIVSQYLSKEKLPLKFGGNRAFYVPSKDIVQMPEKAQFKDEVGYYGTLLHELIHSTGHKDRLNRDLKGFFGDPKYAFEELVAEMGSAMLCGSLGITSEIDGNHIAYLGNWIAGIKEQPQAAIKAASLASKASEYILSE